MAGTPQGSIGTEAPIQLKLASSEARGGVRVGGHGADPPKFKLLRGLWGPRRKAPAGPTFLPKARAVQPSLQTQRPSLLSLRAASGPNQIPFPSGVKAAPGAAKAQDGVLSDSPQFLPASLRPTHDFQRVGRRRCGATGEGLLLRLLDGKGRPSLDGRFPGSLKIPSGTKRGSPPPSGRERLGSAGGLVNGEGGVCSPKVLLQSSPTTSSDGATHARGS